MRKGLDVENIRIYIYPLFTFFGTLLFTFIYHASQVDSISKPIVIITIGICIVHSLKYLENFCSKYYEESEIFRYIVQTSVSTFIFWYVWMIYGTIFHSIHLYTGSIIYVTGMFLFIGCMFLSSYNLPIKGQVKITQFYIKTFTFYGIQLVCILLCFVPHEQNTIRYMKTWDLILHVFVYLITYLFKLFVNIVVNGLQDMKNYVPSIIWILFVGRWFLPFVGIIWCVDLVKLSNLFSSKYSIEEKTEENTEVDSSIELIVDDQPDQITKWEPPPSEKTRKRMFKKFNPKKLSPAEEQVLRLQQLSRDSKAVQ